MIVKIKLMQFLQHMYDIIIYFCANLASLSKAFLYK